MENKVLAEIIKKKKPAVVLTGAGISVPSGIPDFRGPKGLWRKIDPNIFDIDFFYDSPEVSWRYFSEVFSIIEKAKPNPAHRILSRLEKMGYIKTIITQNIDSLHQKAGSRSVIELHGNAFQTVCLKCGAVIPTKKVVEKIFSSEKPLHKDCGGLLKPNVVYFGEPLPGDAVEKAYLDAMHASIFIVIGSSLTVYPAAQLPVIAKENGGYLVIINMGPTAIDEKADLKIDDDASLILPEVYKLIV